MAETLEAQPTQQQATGSLQSEFHLDPRLRPDNFQVLEELDSRLQVEINPTGSRGPYNPDEEISIKWQSHSSLLDATTSSFLVEVENTSVDASGDVQYKFSDGMNCLFDDVEILQGNQVIETTGKYGARWSQHLILGTASQNHYDMELNALNKSYKYRSHSHKYKAQLEGGDTDLYVQVDASGNEVKNIWKNRDLEWIRSADGKKFQALVHLDHLSFFRDPNFKHGMFEYEFKIKLPSASRIMDPARSGASGDPSYKVNSIKFLADQVYPNASILDSLNQSVTESETGLTMILDDTVQVVTQPLINAEENSFVITAPLSNIQGLVAMVVDKTDNKANDNVNACGLPKLKSYNVQVQNTEIGVRGGVSGGLETAYQQYRKLYNMLTDVGGQGMLDFETFKEHHTPLCLSTEILRDAPASVLRNSLETNSRAGQIQLSIKYDPAGLTTGGGNLDLTTKQLLLFVLHKRIINNAQSLVKVGK